MNTQNNRLATFDLLRIGLVTLALVSHLMIHQDWQNIVDESSFNTFKFFSRAAMPGLLITFGFMILYVYEARLDSSPRKTKQAFLSKMLNCYIAFTTLALIAYVQGYSGAQSFIGALLLLSPAYMANLFKIYFFLYPVAFLFLKIKIVRGSFELLSIVFTCVLFADVLNNNVVLFSQLNHFGGLIFGYSDSWGPSILHSTTLVFYGMCLAELTRTRKLKSSSGCLTLLSTFIALCWTVSGIIQFGLKDFMLGITEYKRFRAHNNALYFCYGIVMFIAFWIFYWFINILFSKMFSRLFDLIVSYGRHTFALFYIGNVLILILPKGKVLSTSMSLDLLLFLITCFAMTAFYVKKVKPARLWNSYISLINVPIQTRER